MSLHALANHMATKGRNGDSMLVHMTPGEVAGLHALALKHGGELTTNPDTGLPEASFLKSLLPMLAGAALNFFVPGLGAAVGGAFGVGAAAGTGIAVGGLTSLATGSLSRGLMAGLGAYGGAGMVEGIAGLGAGELAQQQISSNMPTLAEGATQAQIADYTQQVNDLRTAGLQGANQLPMADKFSAGFESAKADPLQFAKNNMMALGAAATPIMADMMVPTATKMPGMASNAEINQSIYDPYSGTYRRLNPVPAANYGTPAYKPFNEGGIVALNNGGVLHYDAGGATKDLTNLYAAFGGKEGYDKLQADYLKINNDPAAFATAVARFDKPSAFTPAPAAVVTPAVTPTVGAGAGKDLTNIYSQLGGKEAYDKIAADYLKATNNNEAGLASLMAQYDKPRPAYDVTDPANKTAMDKYIGNYVTDLTTKFKTPQEQAQELMYRSSTGGGSTAAFDALGGYKAVQSLAESSGYSATPAWIAAYEKKMGYKPSEYTLTNSRITPAEIAAADKAAQDRINADAATAANKVTSTGIVNLLTDTGVKQDKTDTTTTGINQLATTTANGVTSPKTTTDGTYTGTTGTAPTLNTLFGQGKFVGTGTETSTGTTGPMLDYGGTTAFGKTSPMTLAQTQIAEQSAAKNTADKLKLDLYSQWGAANPKATNLEHANFVDKIGLDPAVAARLIGISPEQAQNAYADAKFNKQTGDSLAAYNYLMGKGAYPTKSGVGEIMRPYAEATLGIPANPNKKYIFDQATGKYNLNPDYVAEYKDPAGGTNYLMSQKEIFDYFKKNAGQDDATTYAWALANNLTPKEISEATGVPISQIAPKWRAAAANKAAVTVKNADGTVNQEATDKAIADKAAADKAAADTAANKAIMDNWDEAAYLAANPDVAAELSTGKSVSGQPVKFKSGYEHFTMFGQAGGRKPTVKAGTTTTTGGGNTVATTGGGNTTATTGSTQLTDPSKKPTSDPGARNEWLWDATNKKWIASQIEQAAGGGLQGLAMGGMPMYAVGGGLGSLGSYSDGGRLLRGPGDGVSDSIPATIGQKQQPARLADGEFVVPARIVSELGNGSTDAGAKKLYAMMDRVQRARGKTTGKNKVAANSRADKYLPA